MNSDDGHVTIEQAIADLRLLDDECMRAALQDQKEAVEFILRTILRKPDLVVTDMRTQKDLLQLASGRSLILDVWATDSEGVEYDIEIQRGSGGAQPRRPRYHLSLMDTSYLKRGSDFRRLPITKVIFITETDCIGTGKLIHRFTYRDDNGLELKTGQEIVYLNTAYSGTVEEGDEQLAALARDFRRSDPEEMESEPLAERMRFLKENKKGRAQMSELIERLVENAAKQAAKQAAEMAAEQAADRQLELARDLYRDGKYDIDGIAKLLKLPLETVQKACEPATA